MAEQEWKDIATAPFMEVIVVGRHDWESVATVFWAHEAAKRADLENWVDPPTHWLSGLTLPPAPNGE